MVDPFTTSEEMLLGMARAIIARNETQKKQAELRSKEVGKEDAEPKETKGLIREKRVEELEDVRAEKPLRSPEKSELQNTFEVANSRLKETSEMPSKGEEPTVQVTPTKETTRSMAEERLDEEILTTPKKATSDESFLKGLAESMEKIQKSNQRSAEELCRTEEMLESIRRAREAEEAESVARNAARRVPGVELTKPETMCRREPEDGDASPTSSVGSSTPDKPRLLEQQSQRREKCL